MAFGMSAGQIAARVPKRGEVTPPEIRRIETVRRHLEKLRLERARKKAQERRKALCCPKCGTGLRSWLIETWFPKRRRMAWWLGLADNIDGRSRRHEKTRARQQVLLEQYRRKKGRG